MTGRRETPGVPDVKHAGAMPQVQERIAREGRAVGIKQTEEQAEEEVAVGAINYKRTDGGVILVRGMGIFLEFAQADLKERDRTTGEPLVAYVAFVCSTYGQ
ncbi:hypothetical protein AAFF_G00386800 [Aldrovandia affinis]|uniref:Uncharacterized protein n=1 Tax=Aldrovandia affinis TaxID=143900 RepID=A0AAD7R4D5_9TELE|nr:hypothetical protein AAFF_G00386800 [Aldrovandia affinis]